MNSNIAIIWPSDEIKIYDVLNEMKVFGALIMNINAIKLNKTALKELILDVYSHDSGLNVSKSKNINEKIKRMQSKLNSSVVLVNFSAKTFEQTISIRNRVREKLKTNLPSFDILHCASSEKEKIHLQKISSSLNNYFFKKETSENLISKLQILENWTKKEKISYDDVCIVGGAVLDAHGYKKCDDIDIIISSKIRHLYTDDKSKELMPGLDIVNKNYSKKAKIENWYNDDEIIYNKNLHNYIRGIKFSNLEIVKERKKASRRKKDIQDIKNISKIKENIELISPYAFLLETRLDIVCKYLLFKEFEKTKFDENIINLYKKHILNRTGGVEKIDMHLPNQPIKNNLNDYMQSAKNLYRSMKETGFSLNFPIPYYQNGIENGAHRIACSIALNIDAIPARRVFSKKHNIWGESWFIENQFELKEIELIKKTYKKLKAEYENSIIR
jgi:hypothetical protein